MKGLFIERPLHIEANTINETWLDDVANIPNNAIAAGIGTFRLDLAEDFPELDLGTIESDKMLHFIIRRKRISKRELVLQLHHFNSVLSQLLGKGFKQQRAEVLYKKAPLTLSGIRNYKQLSLIHVALFVSPEKNNRPSVGLETLNIPVKPFAIKVLFEYRKAWEDILNFSKQVPRES